MSPYQLLALDSVQAFVRPHAAQAVAAVVAMKAVKGIRVVAAAERAALATKQMEVSQPLDTPGHIANHTGPAVLVVVLLPAVAEVVAVLRFPLDQARSVMYFYYNAYRRFI